MNRFIKLMLCACLLSFIVPSMYSQQDTIRGIVSSAIDNARLPGATIMWKNSNSGVRADQQGQFIITRTSPLQTDIIISSVGYAKDTIAIDRTGKQLIILLQPDARSQTVVVEETGLQSISKAEIKTEKISSRQLRESACCSLAESFERSPSVEVSYADAATGAKVIQLLGLKGMYTQQLLEAVPGMKGLALPYGMDLIPGAFLESISISKGAASVMNGYEGVAGLINIEMLKPIMSPRLFVNAYANQMNRYELNIASAIEPINGLYAMIMLHGSTFNHEMDGNHDGYIDMPLFDKLNGTFRMEYMADNIEYQFLARYVDDEHRGGMTSDFKKSNALQGIFESTTHIDRREFMGKIGFLELENSFAESFAIQLAGSQHIMHSSFGIRDYSGEQQSGFIKSIAVKQLNDDHKLWYGLSYMYDAFDEQLFGMDKKRIESVPGIFAEDTYTPLETLTIVAGLRIDIHNLFGTIITPRMHLKYSPVESISIRMSAGSGMRVANIFTDNMSAFVNNRTIQIDSILNPEKAWNYGGSITYSTMFMGMPITFDTELYQTRFQNQINTDFDVSPRTLRIVNDSMAYATSLMMQMQLLPWEGCKMNIAWRFNDIWQMSDHKMQRRIMVSPHRALLTLSQSFLQDKVQCDITGMWNGEGRLPSTMANPDGYRMQDVYPSFTRLNAQVSWRTPAFDIYLGAENITNTLQNHVVISPDQPKSNLFDASLVWGVLDNQMFYLGMRAQF
ncbi:MAG: TonB-dependent receptor [Bacteroidetes bacterium]|nr:TonB-dependent receptor [bacterium]NBP63181.1 TonB-dependent receptor [Bacteroidota bacterium]